MASAPHLSWHFEGPFEHLRDKRPQVETDLQMPRAKPLHKVDAGALQAF